MKLFVQLKHFFCIAIVMIFLAPAIADDLIYNNSSLSGYGFNTYNPTYDEFNDIIDYGTSDGERVSKFVFDYYTTGGTVGTIYVKFHLYTSDSDVGSVFKEFVHIEIVHHCGPFYIIKTYFNTPIIIRPLNLRHTFFSNY